MNFNEPDYIFNSLIITNNLIIIHNIYIHLDIKYIYYLSLTNKLLNKVCNEGYLWKIKKATNNL